MSPFEKLSVPKQQLLIILKKYYDEELIDEDEATIIFLIMDTDEKAQAMIDYIVKEQEVLTREILQVAPKIAGLV